MKNFQDILIKELSDPVTAAAYLNEHIQFKGLNSGEHLLQAVRNVLKAQGIDEFANRVGVSRRTIYHVISEKGNPTLELFLKILDELKVELRFVSRNEQPRIRKKKVA